LAEVVSYKNDPPEKIYCQLLLDSGERVLISIAHSGIKISKLGFGGRLRTSTIWRCGRDEIREAFELFAHPEKPLTSTLDAIKDKLIDFQSIAEVKDFFRQFLE
jgi:hypothetical protein